MLILSQTEVQRITVSASALGTPMAFLAPISLEPNLQPRPYRGGSRLAAFRGLGGAPGDRFPEDWVGSVTTVFGHDDVGLSRLPDGRTLREAVASDPAAYLGPDHVAVLGTSTGLLVKVIDAQQRLAVHAHPDRPFARRQLRTPYGKTEAWYILQTAGPESAVFFGFVEDVDEDRLLATVESGQGATLLDLMHRIPVEPGDVIFVPAGTPHAIGEGILLVEAQEPSDLLVRLEWSGYATGSMPSDMGLGFPTALRAVDRTGWDAHRLAAVRSSIPRSREGLVSRLPPTASEFFRLEAGTVHGTLTLAPGFCIVITIGGAGEISAGGKDMPISVGAAVLLPWAAGDVEIRGDLDIVVCRPPDPVDVRRLDPGLEEWLEATGRRLSRMKENDHVKT